MKLRIVTDNHPALHRKSRNIPEELIGSKLLNDFINDMKETLASVPQGGVALAAPQLSVNINLFIFYDELKKEKGAKVHVFINPKLKPLGNKIEERNEGCLSFPGIFVKTDRFKKVQISYINENGKKVKERFSDLNAWAAQHEYDHLQGITLPDRMKSGTETFDEKLDSTWRKCYEKWEDAGSKYSALLNR